MLANQFGHFVARSTYEKLPADVSDALKVRVLDQLGAAAAGFRLGSYRPLLACVEGEGKTSMWFSGRRMATRDAIMLNSFLGHAPYLEDGSRYTGGHPSAVIAPLLTFCENRKVSGRDFLSAVAVAYETFLRLGRPVYPSIAARGFQSTAVLVSVSTAAGFAALLRLSPEAAAHALSIGATLGTGLKEAFLRPEIQPVQVAHSAQGGLVAALLANEGAEGAPMTIENGLFRSFADDVESRDAGALLGEEYRVSETYLKIHGGSRANHAPVDAASAALENASVRPEQIRSIIVKVDTPTIASQIASPADWLQAQSSIGFSIACLLVFGDVSFARFTNDNLNRSDIRTLMGLTDVSADSSRDANYPEKRGAYVEIAVDDGRVLRGEVDNAWGEPEYPFTLLQVQDKVRALACGTLDNHRINELFDILNNLEELDDVKDVVEIMNRAVENRS